MVNVCLLSFALSAVVVASSSKVAVSPCFTTNVFVSLSMEICSASPDLSVSVKSLLAIGFSETTLPSGEISCRMPSTAPLPP